jgi:hypothetical protein
VANNVGVTIDSPQRVRHVAQILVVRVEREVQIRTLSPVVVARKYLTNLEESTLEVIPGRVVEVVYGSNALSISLVVAACYIAVFCWTVQEVLTRGQSQTQDRGSHKYFDLIVFHNECLLYI